jgi:hypothetical protein
VNYKLGDRVYVLCRPPLPGLGDAQIDAGRFLLTDRELVAYATSRGLVGYARARDVFATLPDACESLRREELDKEGNP